MLYYIQSTPYHANPALRRYEADFTVQVKPGDEDSAANTGGDAPHSVFISQEQAQTQAAARLAREREATQPYWQKVTYIA
jgi:hypothetical protein